MEFKPHPSDTRFNDLTGRVIGRLTVLGYAGSPQYRRHYWFVRCSCGREKSLERGNLLSGRVHSCGCLVREHNLKTMKLNPDAFIGARYVHGLTNTPTMQSWNGMVQRCTNSTRSNYKYYGGRGVTVCERWKKFANFLEDMGLRPEGKTIGRIDNNGNYEPSNCRWETHSEQMKNRRPRARNKIAR